MEVYNRHKGLLIPSICREIQLADAICSQLSQKIYEYSDERLKKLEQEYEKANYEVNNLKKVKSGYQDVKKSLIKSLQFQQNEQYSLEQQLQEKERQSEIIERQIIFLDEKSKEQKPHLQSFIKERKKSVKSNHDVQYAKQKLRKLEEKYEKESKQVQYKYRLIKMLKEKLQE